MAGKGDEIKGKAKEAAGAVSGDEDMEREGQADQAEGKVKQAGDKIVDAGRDALDAVRKK